MSTSYLEIDRKNTADSVYIHENMKFETRKFIWQVRFNTTLDPRTVNNTTMYVTTANQTPIKTHIIYNSIDNVIEITPLDEYNPNEAYLLNITKQVKSLGGKHLKNAIQVQFKVK